VLTAVTSVTKTAFHIYRAILESFFYVHSATVDSFVIVSFFLEKHYIPHSAVLSLTNMLRLCQIMPMFWSRCKVVVILVVINCVPATTPAHNVFSNSAVAHILTPLVNLAFGPKSGFKNKCRTRAGFRLVISGSGWVQASK